MVLNNTNIVLQKLIESEIDYRLEIDTDVIYVINPETDVCDFKLGSPDEYLVKDILEFMGFSVEFY